ncbi:MAG TPA: SCO family protein [Blastocatellia bacterium]|nr:SCO family protein [Blastocatellia bacterium]
MLITSTKRSLVLALLLALAPALFHPVSAARVQAAQKNAAQKSEVEYVCPMDSDVKSRKPGKCPRCGMDLREAASTANNALAIKADSDASSSAQIQIPDIAVYDQDGKRISFYSDLVKGKTVAINFIFTSCTTICPPLTATFRKVQQDLGDRVGRDVRLISVSVDPMTDVPERLKSFSAKFGAQPGWSFVTGNKADIDHLLRALGASVGDRNDHTPMILVGNDSARYWTRTYGLARPAVIAGAINEAASKSASTVAPEAKEKTGTPDEAAAAYFPNLPLLTQDDRTVRFFDDLLKGKTVIINFVFTTCTGVCPPMTANLAKVQDYLGDRVGRDVNMITISVDPTIDTPAQMKKYADKFKVKPGWYFLTGKKENVDQVLYKLGGYVEDKLQHSSILIVGNVGTGEFMKMFAMANPSEIADHVLKVAGPAK